jgi:hypothetical protein
MRSYSSLIKQPIKMRAALVVTLGMICACEGGYTPKTEQTPQPTTTKPVAASVSAPAEPERVNITFSSDPPGVDIWIDGVFTGVSPKVVSMPRGNREVLLEFKKDGYVTASQKVTLDQNRPVIAKLRASSQNTKKKR